MNLTIEKLIYGGDGLARTPADADGRSMAVFVPFVLPGETVEATLAQEKPGFARASAFQIVQPSATRVEANCLYFRRCGGCHYQHIRYEQQLEFKAAILRETLQRISKIDLGSELQLHSSRPWNYRNRTRLRAQTQPEFSLGYYRFGSHDFLAVRECPISSRLINETMGRLLEIRGADCPASVEEVELFVDARDEKLLAWAYCRGESEKSSLIRWAESLQKEISALVGVTFFPSRRQPDQEPDFRPFASAGATSLSYDVTDVPYHVGAGAFFQVNRHLLNDLVHTVTTVPAGRLALDLYAGVGLFSVPLARIFHHIFAVEASHLSHAGLVQNVPANVKAVCARTEDYLRSRPARQRPDLVVVDPPRAGLGKVVTRSLVDLAAPRLHYVSCDPATLARDLAPLLASGYRIEEVHLFDLFPQTFHIESVMLLAR